MEEDPHQVEEKCSWPDTGFSAKGCVPHTATRIGHRYKDRQSHNIQAGFKKCGIMPLDRDKVLSVLPAEPQATEEDKSEEAMDDSLMEILKEIRYGSGPMPRKRKKRMTVEAGKSITGQDFSENSTPGPDEDQLDPGPSGESQGASLDAPGPSNTSRHSGSTSMKRSWVPLPDSDTDSDPDEPAMSDLDELEDDDAVACDEAAVKEIQHYLTVNPGDFVLVQYDCDIYPGLVTEKDEAGCLVKALEKSGGNWKWPEVEDILWYANEDIKGKIGEPKYLTRGILEVKELK